MYEHNSGDSILFGKMNQLRIDLWHFYFKEIQKNQKNPKKAMVYYLKLANAIHYSKNDIDSISSKKKGRVNTLQYLKLYDNIVLVPDDKPILPANGPAYSTIYVKKTGDKITAYSIYDGYKELTGNQVEELKEMIKFPGTAQNAQKITGSLIVNKLQVMCGYTGNMQDYILGLVVMKIYYACKVLRLDPENEEAKKIWSSLSQMEKEDMLDYLFTRDYLTKSQKYELLGDIFNKGRDTTFRRHFMDDAIIDTPEKLPDLLIKFYDYYRDLQSQDATTHTTIVKQASRDPNNVFAWLPNEIKSEIIQSSASGTPKSINEQVNNVLKYKKYQGPPSILQSMHNEQIADRVTILLHNVSQHIEELVKAHKTQLFPVKGDIDILNQKISVMKVLERYLRGETDLNSLEATIQNNPLYNKILMGKSNEEDFVQQARTLCNYLVPGGNVIARQKVKTYIAMLKKIVGDKNMSVNEIQQQAINAYDKLIGNIRLTKEEADLFKYELANIETVSDISTTANTLFNSVTSSTYFDYPCKKYLI